MEAIVKSLDHPDELGELPRSHAEIVRLGDQLVIRGESCDREVRVTLRNVGGTVPSSGTEEGGTPWRPPWKARCSCRRMPRITR